MPNTPTFMTNKFICNTFIYHMAIAPSSVVHLLRIFLTKHQRIITMIRPAFHIDLPKIQNIPKLRVISVNFVYWEPLPNSFKYLILRYREVLLSGLLGSTYDLKCFDGVSTLWIWVVLQHHNIMFIFQTDWLCNWRKANCIVYITIYKCTKLYVKLMLKW